MTKAERDAVAKQAERAAEHHRQYVEQQRRERSQRMSQDARAAQRRQERLGALREDANQRRATERQHWQPTPGERPSARPAGYPGVRETQQKPADEHARRSAERAKPEIRARAAPLRAQSERARKRAKLRSHPETRTPKLDERGLRRQLEAMQRQATVQPFTGRQAPRPLRAPALPRWTEPRKRSRPAERRKPPVLRAERPTPRGQLSRPKSAPRAGAEREFAPPTRARAEAIRRERLRRSIDRRIFYQERAGRTRQAGPELRRLRQRSERTGAQSTTAKQAAAGRVPPARLKRERSAAAPGKLRALSRLAPASAQIPPEPASLDDLLWLRTAEGFIVDENGNAVALRGVTVEGLDTAAPAGAQPLADALSLDSANLATLTDLWGVNLVRLPFQAQTILSGNGALAAADLLAGIDDVIASLAASGIYSLLTLEAAVPENASFVALPDQSVFDCWRFLAQHFQDEPAALFEIFASELPVQGNWFPSALALVGTIRAQHPASLIFLGNGTAQSDPAGLPVRYTTGEPVPNVVYTIRVSTQQLSFDEQCAISALAKSSAVFASDWSVDASDGVYRSAEVVGNFLATEATGWAASAWNAQPNLVRNSLVHDFVATRWGTVVQRAMTLPFRQPLQPLLLRDNS